MQIVNKKKIKMITFALQPHYKLDKLLYNSYYHLEVQMNDDWYGNVEFRTVECPNVDTKTYTVCPSVITANNNESETEEDYEHGKRRFYVSF